MLLFCRKAFPDGTLCPPYLKHICEMILGTCGGLPLAIEIIGSNLARRSRRTEEWEKFYRRLRVEMEPNSQLDSMAKLIFLSYHDLPLHLQNCFLYLSIFPEDTEIGKDLLARLWIGEGFVEKIDGITPEEVAENYLHELVDRCLVQVAATDDNGDIEDIRVHDIIRHIIILKAREHNISTIFDGQGEISFQNNVRRLSVQDSISAYSEQAQECKSIRTLYLCRDVGGDISEPFLSNLLSRDRKLLKVLDLTGAQLESIPDEILKLFHLKYLSLQSTNVRFVPKSVGMLQRLQFLNLLGTGVTQLPVEIKKLQHLRHLIIGRFYEQNFVKSFDCIQGVKASFRIGSLKSLQQLYYIEANQVDNIKVVTEIGKLIHLRFLGITKLKREDGNELCSSLRNLRELRRLFVYSVNQEEYIDFQYCKSTDLPRLQSLMLAGRLEKCPELISSLNRLTMISLLYSKLSDDPLKSLHDLPNLIYLELNAAYQGYSLCFKAGGFPKLKELHLFLLEELRWVTVEDNSLPSLQLLLIRVCQSLEEIPTGIKYLTSLQEVEFSNMSNEFVNKLENMDKQSATYKRLIQIPKVVSATWINGGWSEIRRLNKETGTFNNV